MRKIELFTAEVMIRWPSWGQGDNGKALMMVRKQAGGSLHWDPCSGGGGTLGGRTSCPVGWPAVGDAGEGRLSGQEWGQVRGLCAWWCPSLRCGRRREKQVGHDSDGFLAGTLPRSACWFCEHLSVWVVYKQFRNLRSGWDFPAERRRGVRKAVNDTDNRRMDRGREDGE